MATTAQIEANRRNAQKSTGPRTDEGKKRSRLNALDHGGRSTIMVLPAETFGNYESELQAWRMSFKPRNPSEEFLIDGIVSVGAQIKRIDRAETARLSTRMYEGVFDEDDKVDGEVIELGQKLFQDACGPQILHLQDKMGTPDKDGELRRVSDYRVAEDQPAHLIHRLKASGSGCQWLLDRWAELRDLLDRGIPWLAPDKLKAIRLLGRHPIDAYDSQDVARIYLASHVLLNEGGQPFQEILNELTPEEGARYEDYLKARRYEAMAPKDDAAAREMLLEIVDRTTEALEDMAGVFRELAENNLRYAAHRLSWDDTPEGERLRRYELTCKRTWFRMFELLMKIRGTGDELDIATIASLRRSVPTVTMSEIDQQAPVVADDITLPAEPISPVEAPGEANMAQQEAPNEANPFVQAPSRECRDGEKAARIDTPHVNRKPRGISVTGEVALHPAIQRLQSGQRSTLMNLSPIFGEP